MTTLSDSFIRAWQGAGATSASEPVFQELLAAYSQPHRHYHTLQHIEESLATFERVREHALRPFELELAVWFHDAVYDVHAHDNELQSAIWARRALSEAGVVYGKAETVFKMVMATAHFSSFGAELTDDERLLVDIDLSILASAPERFAQYEQQIREEYSFVPRDLFIQKRIEILKGFLDRRSIFQTPHFEGTLEHLARINLAQAQSALSLEPYGQRGHSHQAIR